MNIQALAKGFGLVMLLVGLLGFVPGITNDGLLLGIFEVNAMHNIVHLLTGIVGLVAAGSYAHARLFFQVFGVVYLLVTVLGFLTGAALAIGLIPVNMADNVLHVAITLLALYAGFGTPSSAPATSNNSMV